MDKDELNMYKAKRLLSQTGAEIKQQRKKQTVEFNEIERIILELIDMGGDAYKKIGLSPRTYNEDKNRNSARLTTKYALLGLLSEQNQSKTHSFTRHELGLIFSALTQYIETRAKSHQQEIKDLQLLVLNMMLENKD